MSYPINECCPDCGNDMEGERPVALDGDLVRCCECGYECGIEIDEDGEVYLQSTWEGGK